CIPVVGPAGAHAPRFLHPAAGSTECHTGPAPPLGPFPPLAHPGSLAPLGLYGGAVLRVLCGAELVAVRGAGVRGGAQYGRLAHARSADDGLRGDQGGTGADAGRAGRALARLPNRSGAAYLLSRYAACR